MESSESKQPHSTTPVAATMAAAQPSAIPLDALSVGYGNSKPAASDGLAKTPKTPQRTRTASYPGSPLTPLANLKVLIAAASRAAALEDKRQNVGGVFGCQGDDIGDDSNSRKTKSLSILCKKFLSIAESDVGVSNDFSLERMARSLGTNRRRIYDIINVMEALEMIVKQSKNWYTWLGRDNLLHTLAKLRAMAQDDTEFQSLFDKDVDKENETEGDNEKTTEKTTEKNDPEQEVGGAKPEADGGKPEEGVATKDQDGDTAENDLSGKGGRWDKSLGLLCQKFVMLFLITPAHEVTLDCAGSVLMPDCNEDNPFSTVQSVATSSKTKVRRLYDIANVLTTLGLIKKKSFLAPNHRKMPGYCWGGPPMDEIKAIAVCRKPEPFSLSGSVLYSKKKGMGLIRKPSLSSRPFLHQYHVQTPPHNSAPTTPVKSTAAGSGFKRSLSFGATGLPSSNKCVVARPLSGKQLDYMQEVREFEAEMQKHSHRYPHVASVFHEFIQKYQSTMEQAAASGRSILPKPSTPDILSATKPSIAPKTDSPNAAMEISDATENPVNDSPSLSQSQPKKVEVSTQIRDVTNLQSSSSSNALSSRSTEADGTLSSRSTEADGKTFTKIRICPSNSSAAPSSMRGKRIISALNPCSCKTTLASSTVNEAPIGIGTFQTAVRNLQMIVPNLDEVRTDSSACKTANKKRIQSQSIAPSSLAPNETKNSSPIDENAGVFMMASESPITSAASYPPKLIPFTKPSPSYLLKVNPNDGLLESPLGNDSGIGQENEISLQEASVSGGKTSKAIAPKPVCHTMSVEDALAKTGKTSFTEISKLVSDLSSLVNQIPITATGKRRNFNPSVLLVNPTILASSAILKPLFPAVSSSSGTAYIAPLVPVYQQVLSNAAAAAVATRKGAKRGNSKRDLASKGSSTAKKPRLE